MLLHSKSLFRPIYIYYSKGIPRTCGKSITLTIDMDRRRLSSARMGKHLPAPQGEKVWERKGGWRLYTLAPLTNGVWTNPGARGSQRDVVYLG